MPSRRGRSWDRGLVLARAAALLCAGILAIGPLNHHDVACHLKSSTHCKTCVYASMPGAETPAGVVVRPFLIADPLSPEPAERPAAVLVSEPGGRSPPTA
jgi:hypothetical protein